MTDHVTVHSEAIGAVRLRIVIDPEPSNPRTDFDNLATMACWHRRYRLGDADGPARLRDAVRASGARRSRRSDHLEDPATLAQALAGCQDIVWLPLYLYDHSGITMSTACSYPFNDRWDAGQVGFVFMTRGPILATLASPSARCLTRALRAAAAALMRSEVETYDRYLTGNVFGYVVERETGEHLDSCWGYFGETHCLEEGRAVAASLTAEWAIRQRLALANKFETSRPDMYDAALPNG